MKKVITYGTFDLFHEGHRRLLERAKALGDYLIVGVTSESFDIDRGKYNVKDSLEKRIEAVKNSGYTDEVIVEERLGQKVSDIERLGVDIFVIGSDWAGKFDYLNKYCEVVYLERTKGVSSTDIRNEGAKILRVGIVTDSPDDGGFCMQAHFVSGLEVIGVYVPPTEAESDEFSAEEFKEKYDLANSFDTAEKMHEWSDIVYVHTRRGRRFTYASAALKAGCHVVCDFPLSNPEEAEEIHVIAKDRGLVFMENVPLAYLLSGTTQMIAEQSAETITLSHEKAQKLVGLLERGEAL